MSDLSKATPEQQAKVGAMVAELKTDLHATEILITELKFDEVDWDELTRKSEALFSYLDSLVGKPVVMPATAPKSTSQKHHK